MLGMSGRVRLDSKGGRSPNYIVTQMNPENGFFETFAEIKNVKDKGRVSP